MWQCSNKGGIQNIKTYNHNSLKISSPVNDRSVNFVTYKKIHSQLGNARMQTLIVSSQMVIEETCLCMNV